MEVCVLVCNLKIQALKLPIYDKLFSIPKRCLTFWLFISTFFLKLSLLSRALWLLALFMVLYIIS